MSKSWREILQRQKRFWTLLHLGWVDPDTSISHLPDFLGVGCPCWILNACSWCLPFGCWFHSPVDIWNCCGEPDWTIEDSLYMETHCSQPFCFDCPDVHFVVLWTGYSERPSVCAENMQRAQYIRSPWSTCWTSGVWWKVLHCPWGYSWLQVNRTP